MRKKRLQPVTTMFFLLFLVATAACVREGVLSTGDAWRVRIVAVHPHDTAAYTQGLMVYGGRMYEGTGLYGASSVRSTDIVTGEVERLVPMEGKYFGEGIAVIENRLYQLTWRNETVFVYDADTLSLLKTLVYRGEAWGLTADGAHLILSDGSATLRFLDPETLAVTRQITVHEGRRQVSRLNELEYVQNEIWANIWYKDRIARISPEDGSILGWIDLSDLHPRAQRQRDHVLNGIAYDASSGRLFVTGKNWPTLYEIEVVRPRPGSTSAEESMK